MRHGRMIAIITAEVYRLQISRSDADAEQLAKVAG
jgi:hypothetical protein